MTEAEQNNLAHAGSLASGGTTAGGGGEGEADGPVTFEQEEEFEGKNGHGHAHARLTLLCGSGRAHRSVDRGAC